MSSDVPHYITWHYNDATWTVMPHMILSDITMMPHEQWCPTWYCLISQWCHMSSDAPHDIACHYNDATWAVMPHMILPDITMMPHEQWCPAWYCLTLQWWHMSGDEWCNKRNFTMDTLFGKVDWKVGVLYWCISDTERSFTSICYCVSFWESRAAFITVYRVKIKEFMEYVNWMIQFK